MLEGYIKEIKENDSIVTLVVEIPPPFKPLCPNRNDYSEDEQVTNAMASYEQARRKYESMIAEIEKLHLGHFNFVQDKVVI